MRETNLETAPVDPWRLDEFAALPDVCLIAGCDGSDIDPRGPVQLRTGAIGKACVEHWEGIFRVLGEQATWERTDGARTVEVSTQDAPSRLPLPPQSDAEGSGVAQDVQEASGAQKSTQGADAAGIGSLAPRDASIECASCDALLRHCVSLGERLPAALAELRQVRKALAAQLRQQRAREDEARQQRDEQREAAVARLIAAYPVARRPPGPRPSARPRRPRPGAPLSNPHILTDWRCSRCGSSRWVAASLTGPVDHGGRAIKQCVPCGHYSSEPVAQDRP